MRRGPANVVEVAEGGESPGDGDEKGDTRQALDAGGVLAAAAAGEAGLGELLRSEGLHEADLERFRQEIEGAVVSAMRPGRRGASPEANRVKELERELRRKEKALAETAAILVLRKKLSAFFSAGEEGDMSEESDK